MSVVALTDGYVLLGASNVSAYAKNIKINISADALDSTTFGSTFKGRIVGLKDWSFEFQVNNDFAAAAIDSILFPLVGTLVTIEVRPTSGARSTSNPAYVGSALLDGYDPLSGNVGQINDSTITFKGAGVLQRLTA